ncbi:hypothetical protein [Mycoavidus cysteinexigens]|uniref:hypothetical protein n=1 Tax=Mycoavidus cysteinexigens TaxID=1553431 RepID=UPI0013762F8B|nr:hypothetical protein [Mycoavidus cysteinexigens]
MEQSVLSGYISPVKQKFERLAGRTSDKEGLLLTLPLLRTVQASHLAHGSSQESSAG